VRNRLVQAERHIPGLRGEDRENRRAFCAQQITREQGDERRQSQSPGSSGSATDCKMSSSGIMIFSAALYFDAMAAKASANTSEQASAHEHA